MTGSKSGCWANGEGSRCGQSLRHFVEYHFRYYKVSG